MEYEYELPERQTTSNTEAPDGNNMADTERHELIYGVNDKPPVLVTVLFALQQVMISFTNSVAMPLLVCNHICITDESVKAAVISTALVMCGISTLLQVTLGTRLPLVQGGCGRIIPPVMAMMSLPKYSNMCTEASANNGAENGTTFAPVSNATNATLYDSGDFWMEPLHEIQGSIILASLTEMLLGYTGLVGLIMNLVSPITVTVTISLVGLGLYDVGAKLCGKHWGIAFMTISLLLLFILYLRHIKIYLPTYQRSKGWATKRYPFFQLLPIILAVMTSWIVCIILEEFELYNPKYSIKEATDQASWVYIPYPGQWGQPSFTVSGYLGMLAAVFTSIIESIGDYCACARICGLPTPPPYIINRGIGIEGASGVICGLFGSPGFTTSYSQNIGAIGFTKAASRWIFYGAGVMFIVFGIFGKVGGLLSVLPEPVLGGVLVVGLGVVVAIGISNLQYVDLTSSRNQCILGVSLMIGLVVPHWTNTHTESINTGNKELDQSLHVLLGTAMFVGGLVAFILDNTVPGSAKERGIVIKLESRSHRSVNPNNTEAYDIPFITEYLGKFKCSSYLPICPTRRKKPCNEAAPI